MIVGSNKILTKYYKYIV